MTHRRTWLIEKTGERPFCVICATTSELEAMRSMMSSVVDEHDDGMLHLTAGSIRGRDVFVVKAHSFGKVAAGAATQLAIERHNPRAIISFGSAGALVEDLEVGDVVVAEELIQGDAGVVTSIGFEHTGSTRESESGLVGAKTYACDRSLLDAARGIKSFEASAGSAAKVRFGPVVTCDQFIVSREAKRDLNSRFGALVIEMEAAAVAQIASICGVPFVAVKSVSDALAFDMKGIASAIGLSGESMPSLWFRRARMIAAHPGAVRELATLSRDVKVASRNAAAFTIKLVERL
jgi:adenosylhomocysteine nucleosidase